MSVGDPQDPKSTFNASAVMAQSVATKAEGPRQDIKLSDRAEQVASQFSQNPISPFVLAAILRMIEFVAVVAIGATQVNQILTQCMTAYRELDGFEVRDREDYRNDDPAEDMLGEIYDLRDIISCVAMIEMQSVAWLAKATDHLADRGLMAEGLQLGLEDTLSRSPRDDGCTYKRWNTYGAGHPI